MADRDELVNQFIVVTGLDSDRARFHLESAAWNIELATANFFEEGEHEVDQGSAANPLAVGDDDDDVQELEESPPHLNIKPTKAKKSKPKSNSRFGTIGGLHAEEESDSSEEEGQAFYAGGSDRSGQQVLGPSRKKKDNDAFVKQMFQSAREHGAEELENMQAQAQGQQQIFHGTGYRLGETEGPAETVAGPSLVQHRPQVEMTLKMWKKGFSIDNGDLRLYEDAANKDFLDSISRGEIPMELIKVSRGSEVNLNMEDHRMEEFVRSKASTRAFAGEGHMLGSPAPAVVTFKSSGAAATATSSSATVNVDSSKPITTLQIRLADGQRIVEKFNLSHTVGDVRNHIVASYPQYASASFVLMTTFPNKELGDESQTLEDAKLQNAVIVQRLK